MQILSDKPMKDKPKKPAFVLSRASPVRKGNIIVQVSLIPQTYSICIVAYDVTGKMDERYSLRYFNTNDEVGATKYVEMLFETQGVIE